MSLKATDVSVKKDTMEDKYTKIHSTFFSKTGSFICSQSKYSDGQEQEFYTISAQEMRTKKSKKKSKKRAKKEQKKSKKKEQKKSKKKSKKESEKGGNEKLATFCGFSQRKKSKFVENLTMKSWEIGRCRY